MSKPYQWNDAFQFSSDRSPDQGHFAERNDWNINGLLQFVNKIDDMNGFAFERNFPVQCSSKIFMYHFWIIMSHIGNVASFTVFHEALFLD